MKSTQALMAALLFFFLSISSLQAVLLTSTPQNMVLGTLTVAASPTFVPPRVTPTPTPMPVSLGNVPCSYINELQNRFCSTAITPTVTPTKVPTPTSIVCKTGVMHSTLLTSCGSGLYRYISYTCYDGVTRELGGPSSCKSESVWKQYAEEACVGITSCSKISPTPTPATTVIKPKITSSSPATAGKNFCLYGTDFTTGNLGNLTPSQAYLVMGTSTSTQAGFKYNAFDTRSNSWAWNKSQVCFDLPANLTADIYNFNICVLNVCSVPGINVKVSN